MLSTGKATQSKSKSVQSFRAIVDTVQDVAVVDMKPGCIGVDFASKETKGKRKNRGRGKAVRSKYSNFKTFSSASIVFL